MGMIIRTMVRGDLDKIVDLHMAAFGGFFLSSLGKPFLLDLYDSFICDESSICFVADEEGILKGFAVGNQKPARFFKILLIRKNAIFIFHAIKAFIKNPVTVTQKFIYALQYRGECPAGFRHPSLLSSLGVDPADKGKGIGSKLIEAFCLKAFEAGADVVYLTTDKTHNDSVNDFYIKNGFRLESVFEKSNHRKMNRYIKLPDEKDN